MKAQTEATTNGIERNEMLKKVLALGSLPKLAEFPRTSQCHDRSAIMKRVSESIARKMYCMSYF